MQKPIISSKPPIAAKPRNVQKSNYVVIPPQPEFHNNIRAVPISPRQQKHSTFHPSTPPSTYQIPFQHQYLLSSSLGDTQQRHNYYEDSNIREENGNQHSIADRYIRSASYNHTPSHSLDSSSSSSGGFRDVDFVAKAKALYEMHETHHSFSNDNQQQFNNIGHSKVQEIQSKLLHSQQQCHSQNSEEPVISINRNQIKKSTQELEKLFGMRVAATAEKETRYHQKSSTPNHKPVLRMLSKGSDDEVDNCSNSLNSQLTFNISKQIHQKLQQEMKQQCEIIKDKYLIEKIAAQQHYQNYMVFKRIKFSNI